MKKISLDLAKKHLARDEMRTISGGSGSVIYCNKDSDCPSGMNCNKPATSERGFCQMN